MVRARAPVALAALAGLAGCGVVEWTSSLDPWEVPVADPPEALSEPARTTYQEPSGAVWLATAGGALRFDPRASSFTRLTERDGLAGLAVQGFQPGLDGSVWIGTGSGVSRFDPATGRILDAREDEPGAPFFGDPEEPWRPEEQSVRALAAPAGGDRRWWGIDDRSWLFSLDSEGRGYEPLLHPQLAGRRILSLAPEPQGDVLWLGTTRGLLRLVRATGEVLPTRLAEGEIPAVHRDADGALWLWRDARLVRFVPSTGETRVFPGPRGLGATVRALFRAPEGGPLWLVSLDGPVRFDPATGETSLPPRRTAIPPDDILALWRENGGALWLAARGRLARLDPAAGRSIEAPPDLLDDGESATVFHQETAGPVWLGTSGGRLIRFDPRSGSWSQPVPRLRGWVMALLQEPAGPLWVAASKDGLVRFDPSSGRLRAYTDRAGLPGLYASALWRDADGGLLLAGGPFGVVRHDARQDRFVPWPPARAVSGHRVRAILGEGRVLWIATEEDLVRVDLDTGASRSATTPRLTPAGGDTIRRVLQVPGRRSLWIETERRALLRFDTGSGSFASLPEGARAVAADPAGGGVWASADVFGQLASRSRSGLPSSLLRIDDAGRIARLPPRLGWSAGVLAADPAAGALWTGSVWGLERAVFTGGEAGAHNLLPAPDPSRWRTGDAPPARLALAGRTVVRSRGSSLAFAETRAAGAPVLSALRFDQPVWDVAPGPNGRVWAALRLGGVRLCGARGGCASLAAAGALPSADAHALALVPGSGGRAVWVATAGGAARVRAEGSRLRVERTATAGDGLPSGPVAALAALPDGSAFLAYNFLDPRFFGDPGLAARRSKTRVRYVPARGAPAHEIVLTGRAAVLALGLSPDGGTLWAGTADGLYRARDARRAGSRFEAVLPLPGKPVTALAVDGRGTVWSAVQGRYGLPSVEGYRPGTRTRRTLEGFPEPGGVDDLEISENGELVVLVGSRLASGRVAVPPFPLPDFDRIPFSFLVILLLLVWRAVKMRRARKAVPPPARSPA